MSRYGAEDRESRKVWAVRYEQKKQSEKSLGYDAWGGRSKLTLPSRNHDEKQGSR